MVESKDGRSRFIQYKATAVRFSVDAFLLRGGSNKVSKIHLEETFYSVCLQAYCYNLAPSYLDFTSSSCTATCQWAAPWPLLQPSPATTTPEQRGLVTERKHLTVFFPTGESHALICSFQMGWALRIRLGVRLLRVLMQCGCISKWVFPTVGSHE